MRRGRGALLAVVLLAVLCTGLGYVLGQRHPPSDSGSETYLSVLTRSLELRPEQVAAIDRLLAEEDADIQDLVIRHREQMREPVAARRQRTEDAMLALLDSEQRTRYDELSRGVR